MVRRSSEPQRRHRPGVENIPLFQPAAARLPDAVTQIAEIGTAWDLSHEKGRVRDPPCVLLGWLCFPGLVPCR